MIRKIFCALFITIFITGISWAQNPNTTSQPTVPAQNTAPTPNTIEFFNVNQQGGNLVVKIETQQPLTALPLGFSVVNPPRIALDFPNTVNGLGRTTQEINEGDLRSINIVQAGERTRLIFNLKRSIGYELKTEGKSLFVVLNSSQVTTSALSDKVAHFAESQQEDVLQSIRDVDFRRGKTNEGRVLVELSNSNTGIDIRTQGNNIVVDFLKTTLPESLRRRIDVVDFGTPIQVITVFNQGENVRMVIEPQGLWEHNAYQTDTQFVLEVKPVIEDPNKLVQGSRGGYKGEKLSLNFQNVDVRSVLQVIADFTNLNIITSDTVGGNLTLRLKDVPWDQALDIILQTKGLDMRKNGNVVWIAPRDELTTKEKLELESKQQISDLEPIRTETFQLNYQKAEDITKLLKGAGPASSLLSRRGNAVFDNRTNILIIQDTGSRLDEVRKLIAKVDIAVRQVLIEARIVEASDNFSKNLGVRLGLTQFPQGAGLGKRFFGSEGVDVSVSGNLSSTGFLTGQIITQPLFHQDALNVNLPAAAIAGAQQGQFGITLFNAQGTRALNLELSALEADGKGKVISSPRVVTADKIEATIEQGTELPYQQATSSGATSISFKKANLSLKVRPQITPDGNVIMEIDVTNDTPNTRISSAAGIAIDTKHVKTQILIENGGTVMIGGIYRQTQNQVINRIPFLGDLPYIGFLFKQTSKQDDKTEMLIFITPKILNERLTVR